MLEGTGLPPPEYYQFTSTLLHSPFIHALSFTDDGGITGLLGRHVEVPKPAFKKMLEVVKEMEMQATIDNKAPVK